MSALIASRRQVYCNALCHLLDRLKCTQVLDQPFCHFYVDDALPQDLYDQLLHHLPHATLYNNNTKRRYTIGWTNPARSKIELSSGRLESLSKLQKELWMGIAAALTAPELKCAVYAKLSKDLAFRFGVPEERAAELAGYARPTLCRETAGFEAPPHPETRKKVVTMHLPLPADRSQLDQGIALYRQRTSWPFGDWRTRFEKVKQFDFRPNSAFAFVVYNTLTRKSWHGRETPSGGASPRTTLVNTFYKTPVAFSSDISGDS